MPYQYPKVTDKWEILLALENYKYEDDLFTYMNLLGSLLLFMVKLPSVDASCVFLQMTLIMFSIVVKYTEHEMYSLSHF